MKLFQQNGECTIIVDTQIDTAEEFERFLQVTAVPRKYHIFFSNNITLKREVVLYLVQLVESLGKQLDLHVKEPFLSTYLNRLGIPHQRNCAYFDADRTTVKNFEVILLGGSAGSTEKILQILELLPKNDSICVIVQHIKDAPNLTFDTLI